MARYVFYVNKFTGPRINRLSGQIVLKKNDVVQMIVAGVALDTVTKIPLLILMDLEKQVYLPILVDLIEVPYIVAELEGIKLSRPMPHDLINDIVTKSCGWVTAVEISDVKENTFHASIHLISSGERLTVNSRAGDAIAMALRSKCPIYVAKSVLDTAGTQRQAPADRELDLSCLPKQKWGEILEGISAKDFKYPN